jgi:hypothetical protein
MRLGRVLALLGLAVAAGIALIGVRAHNLRLQQKITELSYLHDELTEDQAQLRLMVNRFAAPARLIESVEREELPLYEPRLPVAREPREHTPLNIPR